MARTTYVASARKTKGGERPTCYTCQEPIGVGQAYAWNQPSRFSRRYQWHQDCPAPNPSVLETNEKRSTALAAFEDAYDALSNLTFVAYNDDVEAFMADLQGILDQCAEGVREAAELWRESANNIEDGFGHATSTSDEMNDHADTYDSVADEVEQCADQLDERDAFESFEEWTEAAVATVTEDLGNVEGNLD
jgi:uncharacterized protein YukE